MKKIAAMLLLVLLAAGCAKTPAQTAKTEQMPQDFAICFAWWYNLEQKNSMDTATGKLQKDLLADGTASAEFQPDEELLQRTGKPRRLSINQQGNDSAGIGDRWHSSRCIAEHLL